MSWWSTEDWQKFLSAARAVRRVKALEEDPWKFGDEFDVMKGAADIWIHRRKEARKKEDLIKVVYIVCYVVTEGILQNMGELGADVVIYDSDVGLTWAAEEASPVEAMKPEEFRSWLKAQE